MNARSGRKHGRRGRHSGLSSETAFWLFAGFFALVMLMGGGSRADIASNGPLRALAALLLAVGIWYQTRASLRRVLVPLAALVALVVLMALQLVPLPPGLWGSLPGREPIVRLGELAGMADTWRPLTFSPMKTGNALASLVVPLAALVMVSLLDDRHWRLLPWVFIAAGVASALFGIAQVLAPGARGLYLYAVTNTGSAVGLFSNRNHNAMFLTVALLFCVLRLEHARKGKLDNDILAAGLAGLVILAGILVNASRSGLVGLGLVGLIFGIRAIMHWQKMKRLGTSGVPPRVWAGLGVGIFSLVLVGAFAAMGRSPAISRLLAEDPGQDLRVQALPTVLAMLQDFQPFGIGFGSFDYTFMMREPAGMLSERYLNNVHNDWLQFPLEGGLPATALALVLLALFGKRCWQIYRDREHGGAMLRNAAAGGLALGLLMVASLADYPLRTPSIMVLAIVAAAMVFKPIADSRN